VVQVLPSHLPADLGGQPVAPLAAAPEVAAESWASRGSLTLSDAVADLEASLIAEALHRSGDNKRRAAALLGISERALWYKLGRTRVAS